MAFVLSAASASGTVPSHHRPHVSAPIRSRGCRPEGKLQGGSLPAASLLNWAVPCTLRTAVSLRHRMYHLRWWMSARKSASTALCVFSDGQPALPHLRGRISAAGLMLFLPSMADLPGAPRRGCARRGGCPWLTAAALDRGIRGPARTYAPEQRLDVLVAGASTWLGESVRAHVLPWTLGWYLLWQYPRRTNLSRAAL